MPNYDVKYEILDYEKYNERLKEIYTNPNNKFPVVKLPILGQSRCGFYIEHCSIGNGSTQKLHHQIY